MERSSKEMELFSSTGDIDHLKSALMNFYKNYYTGTLTLNSFYLFNYHTIILKLVMPTWRI